MRDDKRVIIFDTTLRDGEQALQQSLNVKQKLQIALSLEDLGVDVIEAGFPVSSPGDFTSVQAIARECKRATICGLSRCVEKDIDAAYEALKVADHFRIHTFIATSNIHVKDKLRKGFDDIVEMAVASVKRARNYTDDVEFSCEDAGRTNINDLITMVEKVIDAGATTVNIPDTVGYTIPLEFHNIIKTLFDKVPNIDKAIISVHCHNDLGMATGNSLSALLAGARQIECAVNGLGERAGNCSLEEVAMSIKTRSNYFGGLYTNIIAKNISKTSTLVANICNEPVPSHKAIVGSNAFAHSSGIHQDGVLKNRNTYEIITPESIGIKENNLHMTARSGRHMIKACLDNLGYSEKTYDLDKIYQKFLALADKKGEVFDYDVEALLYLDDENDNSFVLKNINVLSGNGIIATATVKMAINDEEFIESATGNGPVDAAFNAILRITKINCTLQKYELKAKGQGNNAQGQVDVTVSYDNKNYYGKGLSTDVVVASANAFVNALNSIQRAIKVKEIAK